MRTNQNRTGYERRPLLDTDSCSESVQVLEEGDGASADHSLDALSSSWFME